MWKAVGSVQFQMDAREVYQTIVNAGDAGPVVELSANGVRFSCRPRPGLAQPGQYVVLFEAGVTMESPPTLYQSLISVPPSAVSGKAQSWRSNLVLAQLILRQLEPGGSEGVLQIVPLLQLPELDARCLLDLMVRHVVGSAFHEFCKPLLHGLAAGGGRSVATFESWPPQDEVATLPGPAGIWLPESTMPLDMAMPRVITVPCPGRPRALEDDWVYVQVDLLGRDSREVYREWLDLMPKERRAGLKDPYRSFRFALSSRRKKAARYNAVMSTRKLVGQEIQ